jgi:hypothetical protein
VRFSGQWGNRWLGLTSFGVVGANRRFGGTYCNHRKVGDGSLKTDNSSFERVEEFRYLGTTATNQNSIQEEIKGRLKSGNACYHSVQSLLSSSLLFKNL